MTELFSTIVKIYITFYEKEQNLSQICLFLMIVVQMTPSHYLYKIHFCELFLVCETLDINLARTPGLWTITQYDWIVSYDTTYIKYDGKQQNLFQSYFFQMIIFEIPNL